MNNTLEEGKVYQGRYLIGQRIGRGGFSVVYRAEDNVLEKPVAIKQFSPIQGMDQGDLQRFQQEYELMKTLDHPYLMRTMNYFLAGESPCLVFPLYTRGSLFRQIKSASSGLSEKEIARLLFCIGGGLSYMHGRERQLLHNDIKPDNILISLTNDYILTDFGISTETRKTMSQQNPGQAGPVSSDYASPEILGGRPPTPETDVFSLGILLYECCEGVLAQGLPPATLIAAGQGDFSVKNTKYSRRLCQMVAACIEMEPGKRPTAAQLETFGKHYLDQGMWPDPAKQITATTSSKNINLDKGRERKTTRNPKGGAERKTTPLPPAPKPPPPAQKPAPPPPAPAGKEKEKEQPAGLKRYLPWALFGVMTIAALFLLFRNTSPKIGGGSIQYNALMESHGDLFDRCLEVDYGEPLLGTFSEAELSVYRNLFETYLEGHFSSTIVRKSDLITDAKSELEAMAESMSQACNCEVKINNCQ